jgi:hypothetical protein
MFPTVDCRFPTIRRVPFVSVPPDVVTTRAAILDGDGIALKDAFPPNESDDATMLTGRIRHCVA